MAANSIAPENPEERLIWSAIVGSWAFYSIGALYIVGPAVAVALLAKQVWRHYIAPARPATRPEAPPLGVMLWIAGMVAMLIALLVAHNANELGAAQTLKSAIGWLKGWGLLAAFPLAGACLRIRAEVVVRAYLRLARQTLVITPFLIAAALVHLPSRLFVSPLSVIGGPGPEFFAIYLYIVDPSDSSLRWQFFAPWAPAAGMIGNMIFVLAFFEQDRRFRYIGIAAGVMMALLTRSRMAMLFIGICPVALWVLSRLSRSWLLSTAAALSVAIGIIADTLIGVIQNAVAAFRGARADSTRVRETLGRIAVDRWWDEAPVWGHGIVVRGGHNVEFMPIGSHHTWYGLLYVKGAVGFMALAIPLAWSLIEMILLAQVSRLGRLGLAIVLMLIFYSFGENLEILAYLCWPGLILLGCALREAAFRRTASTEAAQITSGSGMDGCGMVGAPGLEPGTR